MSFHDAIAEPSRKNRPPAADTRLAAPGRMLQRKCACGIHSRGGDCDECRRKRSVLDRGTGDRIDRAGAGGNRRIPSPSVPSSANLDDDHQQGARRIDRVFARIRSRADPLPVIGSASSFVFGMRQAQHAGLSPIVEDVGWAACDPDKGTVVWGVDVEKIPLCMADCAAEHEKAHKRFMDAECAKVSAAIKTAEDAIKAAQKSGSEADLEKAEKAAKEAEKAVAAYEKWFKESCRENEAQAYQASIDACRTKDVRKKCADTGEAAEYEELMRQWKKFKKNPPNCPAPEPEKEKEAPEKSEEEKPEKSPKSEKQSSETEATPEE